MTRPQFGDGRKDLQMWRVAANTLNKQSRTVNKGWSSNCAVGRSATTHRHKNAHVTKHFTKPRTGTDSLVFLRIGVRGMLL
jgi:hypothetical protein